MIVGLHLHQDVHRLVVKRELACGRVRKPAPRVVSANHRRVVGVRTQDIGGVAPLIGVANHAEQALGLLRSVNRPRGVEDLVPAVFAVRLREHHQLDIRGIAAEFDECRAEVLNLIGHEGKSELAIRALERLPAPTQQINRHQRASRLMRKQPRRIVEPVEYVLHHPVVQRRRDPQARRRQYARVGIDVERDAPLDTFHVR